MIMLDAINKMDSFALLAFIAAVSLTVILIHIASRKEDQTSNHTTRDMASPPLRVALLYSGMQRNLQELMKHHRDIFLHPEVNVEVYCSFWEFEESESLRDEMANTWGSKVSIRWETEPYTGEFADHTTNKLKAQMYRYHKVFQMIANPNEYDFMIRMRTDVLFLFPFPYHLLKNGSVDGLVFYTSYFAMYNPGLDFLDFCYAMRPSVMKHLSSMVTRYPYWDQTLSKDPDALDFYCENITRLELESIGAKILRTEYSMTLERTSNPAHCVNAWPYLTEMRNRGKFVSVAPID